MLVDKNFIFISLPRCASTSFMITCLKNKISIEHFNSNYDNQLININDWKRMNNEELADSLTHAHETLHLLQSKQYLLPDDINTSLGLFIFLLLQYTDLLCD